MLDTLTHGDFEGRIGETFSATAEERTLTLTLRSADALHQPPGDQRRTPFSLVFTDPDPEHVPQQTVAETGSKADREVQTIWTARRVGSEN